VMPGFRQRRIDKCAVQLLSFKVQILLRQTWQSRYNGHDFALPSPHNAVVGTSAWGDMDPQDTLPRRVSDQQVRSEACALERFDRRPDNSLQLTRLASFTAQPLPKFFRRQEHMVLVARKLRICGKSCFDPIRYLLQAIPQSQRQNGGKRFQSSGFPIGSASDKIVVLSKCKVYCKTSKGIAAGNGCLEPDELTQGRFSGHDGSF